MFNALKSLYYRILRKKRTVFLTLDGFEIRTDWDNLSVTYFALVRAEVRTVDGTVISVVEPVRMAEGDTMELETVTEMRL